MSYGLFVFYDGEEHYDSEYSNLSAVRAAARQIQQEFSDITLKFGVVNNSTFTIRYMFEKDMGYALRHGV